MKTMKNAKELLKEFEELTKGLPVYRVAVALSNAVPGIDYRGCTKKRLREVYTEQRGPGWGFLPKTRADFAAQLKKERERLAVLARSRGEADRERELDDVWEKEQASICNRCLCWEEQPVNDPGDALVSIKGSRHGRRIFSRRGISPRRR